MNQPPVGRVTLGIIAREWTRLGVTGFGGPPAHIAMLRALCVEQKGWLAAEEFEDGIAATSLLPGPTSTQLAIFCAWRLRGTRGALLGGLCFIVPGLIIILALAALFLAHDSPRWVQGLAAGAGAGVPAVAVSAALALLPASWGRVSGSRARQARWAVYLAAGAAFGALAGQYLVAALAAGGLIEVKLRRRANGPRPERELPRQERRGWLPIGLPLAAGVPAVGGLGALAWVALKVGALSFGGGFVIIPLMQHDAVSTYHWMTSAQFLNAVALGQVTPGPVVQTVSVVGYAAAGIWGGLLAAAVAFAPSFAFVIAGAPHFGRLRASATAQAFLTGAGACAIGGIAGAAIPLAIGLSHLWQAGVVLLAAVWLIALRRGVVTALAGCGVLGVIAMLAGAPLS
ncbi:MAG TPA: chromate efflux transporter [Streptosporangiaceae bacterium]|jgi:chromate transporter